MNESNDIRLSFLEYLEAKGSSTQEIICNEFFSKLHPDIGTTIRAVIELLELGYVKESHIDWKTDSGKKASPIANIDTSGSTQSHPNKQASRWLNFNDVGAMRFYITLEGKKFLIDNRNLKRSTWNIKYDIPIKLAFVFVGGLVTIVAQLAMEAIEKPVIPQPININIDQIQSEAKDTTIVIPLKKANK